MTTLDERTTGTTGRTKRTTPSSVITLASLDGPGGRRINRELIARLGIVGVGLATPAALVLPALATIAAAPPPWCAPDAWERLAHYLGQWATSFGALDVWHALETAGGSKEAVIHLHQRTLPELRKTWMPRVGLTPPER